MLWLVPSTPRTTAMDMAIRSAPGYDPHSEGLVAVKSIIVLDGDEGIRDLIVDVLSQVDRWTAQTVATGSDLLAMVEAVTPDLIVLDTRLPGLSGLEIYNVIRERKGGAEIPVLFLSTRKEHDTAELRGPFRWLEKPFEVDEMLTAVAKMLGEGTPDEVG